MKSGNGRSTCQNKSSLHKILRFSSEILTQLTFNLDSLSCSLKAYKSSRDSIKSEGASIFYTHSCA